MNEDSEPVGELRIRLPVSYSVATPAERAAETIASRSLASLSAAFGRVEAQNAELRALAQKTADRECAYLRLIAARDARIAELYTMLAQRPAIQTVQPERHNPFREFPSDPRRLGPLIIGA